MSFIKSIVFVIVTVFNISAQNEQLKFEIEKILSKLPSTTRAGILIYDPITRDTLYGKNCLESMIPASNTKLFTTAAALNYLGKEFNLSTKIFTDDDNLNDGVINGNIYLKGFGNPLFSEDDLIKSILRLKEIGITEITGNVIGDDSYFDDIYSRTDWIPDEVANVTLPPVSALVYENNKTVVARKYKRRTWNYIVNIDNPPVFISKVFRDRLLNHEINVKGSSNSGITPDDVTLLYESKVPLIELIKFINKNSDNFFAECLFKTIGAESSGLQGNSFYAQQAVLTYIRDNGIYSEGTSLVDGSGISRFDQVTVAALVGVLENMYFDLANFDDFFNSLSIAGVDGTLKGRMIGTKIQGNFRGKTGTLNGVSSLSGYLTTSEGNDLIISMIFEFSHGRASLHKRVQDEILLLLSDWQSDLSLRK
ncbi:MAG: D-alanyl-D-alanine carboxypeptidase/D-alanyl-D-alanine-endopeptidase [Ignavibacteriales bacterium]|nr:MAG: D-alanyl-D-alanine carboxypeptidase/D-alanyl-D-alanine-endopeptidase [Ignavibacteriales bacterium]